MCFLLMSIQNNDLVELETTTSTTTATTTTSTNLVMQDKRINSNRYVVMSTTFDDNYTFYMPMVVHAWRRINIEPILVLIYDNAKFKHKKNTSSHQTLSYLKNQLNLNILNLTVNANYSIVISQVIRMFIGIFPKHIIDDDKAFVMTSDSDLTPFNIDYYRVNMDRVKETITVWNAYCCSQFQFIDGKTYRMYPMGHIGMTKKNWRQAIELEEEEQSGNLDGDLVLKKLFQIYGKEFKQDPGKGGNSWYADQQLVSMFVN
jgi:hypothetical protein